MTTICACCYAVDEGYLVPTLLSARQLRACSPGCDVIVFLFDEPSQRSETFRKVFSAYGIQLRYAARTTIDNMPIHFARFFLARLLENDHHEHILYLDGDTQIISDVAPLMEASVPGGCVLAALDPMAIVVDDRLRARNLAYFASIGINAHRARTYRNSGVLRFNRRDWGDIGRLVIAASAKACHAYRFFDQDALNLCCHERILTMSFKWNFPSFFLGLHLRETIQPAIVHFMSRPRPWDGSFAPWGHAFFRPYGELVVEHPDLAAWIKPADLATRVRYHLQQQAKRVIENPAWQRRSVWQQIVDIEKACLV